MARIEQGYSSRNTGSSANNKPKADGFINIYVPGKNGSRRKLGAIFLFDSDHSQQKLRDWLEEDPANIGKLAALATFEYNPNKPDEDKEFMLPD